MRARRGFTLAEALVALAIGLLVIGAILVVFYSLNKMSRSSELSGALQEAALAMSIVQRDLVQAVQRPDPTSTSPVLVEPNSFQMIRGVLRPDGRIDGQRITYRKQPTASGAFRLRRDVNDTTSLVPGAFKSVQFAQLDGNGGPFVRVTMRLEVQEGGAQECMLSSLVRVCGPELIGSPAFSWDFMDSLLPIVFHAF